MLRKTFSLRHGDVKLVEMWKVEAVREVAVLDFGRRLR